MKNRYVGAGRDALGRSRVLGQTPSATRKQLPSAARHGAAALPKGVGATIVNAGMVALHGELMPPEILRSMVQDALHNLQYPHCEQTIIATAVKLDGEFFPEKLSLIRIDDISSFFIRSAKQGGYYSRHYVTPVRQLIYRDALKLRLNLRRLITGRAHNGDT
jgi:hypothetical protein